MNSFPPLRLAVLQGLVHLQDNVEALDDAACPYDNETKDVLRKLLAPRVVEKIVEKEVGGGSAGRGRPSKDVKLDEESQKEVLSSIQKTLKDLEEMDVGDKGLETSARIQIAKTKTNLLDQLLKMMERHTAVVRLESFKETVIGVLEDLVTEADREIFLKRIEPFR